MSLGWDVGFREKRQKFNRDGSSKNALGIPGGTWRTGTSRFNRNPLNSFVWRFVQRVQLLWLLGLTLKLLSPISHFWRQGSSWRVTFRRFYINAYHETTVPPALSPALCPPLQHHAPSPINLPINHLPTLHSHHMGRSQVDTLSSTIPTGTT
jgi:hypothetical protein